MRLLTYPELRERGIKYSRQHLDRLMKAKQFPLKIQIGAARIGWVESEVDAWLKAKADARH
jgi:prophage regulatory protein